MDTHSLMKKVGECVRYKTKSMSCSISVSSVMSMASKGMSVEDIADSIIGELNCVASRKNAKPLKFNDSKRCVQ